MIQVIVDEEWETIFTWQSEEPIRIIVRRVTIVYFETVGL